MSRKIINYKVVSWSCNLIASEVMDHLKNGWELHGTAMFVPNGNLYQPMVKYEDEGITKPKVVIVDIDGTISKLGERLKYLKTDPVNWDMFYEKCFEDDPVYEVINLVKTISKVYRVVFCSGRRESCRRDTERWLKHQGLGYIKTVLLRKNGDTRHDTLIKPEMLAEAGINVDAIAFVLEDRDSVVKMWRDLGVKCLQVAEGNF